ELRLVAPHVRRSSQQRGNRGGQPCRQPRVGTYVFAVVRRAVDTILEAVQAADCGRALASEVGDWWTSGMVAGWQRVGRRRPSPGLPNGSGGRSVAQAFVFGSRGKYLATADASGTC